MRRPSGFSLLELTLAISIAALLAGLAVPAFSTLVQDTRRTSAVNAFVIAVQLARSEAAKRAEETVLCKSGGTAACVSDGEWEGGWIVFVNLDRDSPPKIDAPEPVLHRQAPLPVARLTANRAAFSSAPSTRPRRTGRRSTATGAAGPRPGPSS
jgi:type IV fimbrial biogenesis protein FimT